MHFVQLTQDSWFRDWRWAEALASGPQASVTGKLRFSNQFFFLWFWSNSRQWVKWVPANFPKGGRGLIAIICLCPYNSKPCVNQLSCFMRFLKMSCVRQDNFGGLLSIKLSQNIIYQISGPGDELLLFILFFSLLCFSYFIKRIGVTGRWSVWLLGE